MVFVFLLSKENFDLSLGEIESVLNLSGNYEILEKIKNLVLVEIEKIDLEIIKRLALTKEVFLLLKEFENFENFKVDFEVKGSFCVREKNFVRKKLQLDKKISELIKEKTGQKINLKNPENFYKVFVFKEKKFFCKRIWENKEKFEQRKNQFRPFKFPTSIHPKWARALVNLTEIKRGEKILDPFCGTGGFLIEAGLIGARVYGSDISEKMVKGTKKNLEFFGLKGKIEVCDISEIEKKFREKFDCVIAGLPYGIASKKVGNTTKIFLEKIPKMVKKRIVFTSNLEEIEFDGKVLRPKFKIYIHKNLSNYIYIIDKISNW